MMNPKWTRRRFIRASVVSTQLAFFRRLFGASRSSRDSLFDQSGAEYLLIEPGTFHMGEQRKIPLSMCEPLGFHQAHEDVDQQLQRDGAAAIQQHIPG